MNRLHDLFVDELKDIYSAEKQILKALPKMIRRAQNPDLVQALREHLEQTEMQVERLDQAFEELETTPRGKKCKGMEGLLEEGDEILDHDGEPGVIDAGIIGAAQRVEHYEIAAYGTAVAHARAMQHRNIEQLLQQTLDEEYGADKLLTKVAEGHVNRVALAAADVGMGDGGTGENTPRRRGNGGSRGRATSSRSGR